jgi:signal peptidase I
MLRLIKVTGESLSPEYQEGDFVLIAKIPFFLSPIKPGDMVVFKQPGYGTLIKRIERADLSLDEYFVIGMHERSVDSRIFGPIRGKTITGKVIWHIKKSNP